MSDETLMLVVGVVFIILFGAWIAYKAGWYE